jgi:YHS domain-containing protein
MKLRYKILIGVAAVAVIGFAGFQAFMYSIHYYATAPVYQTSRGALDGYDPVAYFATGGPQPGKAELTHDWGGATWHFATAENLAAFREDPERYAPQFGGYCAYAVANGYTAKTAPEAWDIADGRLYLNFDEATREKWRQDKTELIHAAAANWPAVIQD